MHGYDVRRTLLTWRADEWANVNPGSIYHALKTLTRDGFFRVAETGRRGSRPERTAYELTADGQTDFATLLRKSLWTVSSYSLPLHAGLAFVTALRRDEVLAVMRNRRGSVRLTHPHRRYGAGLGAGRSARLGDELGVLCGGAETQERGCVRAGAEFDHRAVVAALRHSAADVAGACLAVHRVAVNPFVYVVDATRAAFVGDVTGTTVGLGVLPRWRCRSPRPPSASAPSSGRTPDRGPRTARTASGYRA